MASIFTKIVNREIPAHIVAEDNNHLAFLDINPLVMGHTLVIPKREEDYIYDLSDDETIAINLFAKKVEIVQMDKDTLIQFRKTTHDYVEKLKAKYPDVKKIVDSQQAFVKEFAPWRKARSNVVPWPDDDYVKGKME